MIPLSIASQSLLASNTYFQNQHSRAPDVLHPYQVVPCCEYDVMPTEQYNHPSPQYPFTPIFPIICRHRLASSSDTDVMILFIWVALCWQINHWLIDCHSIPIGLSASSTVPLQRCQSAVARLVMGLRARDQANSTPASQSSLASNSFSYVLHSCQIVPCLPKQYHHLAPQ